jgi:hypothetical protein
MDGDLDQLLPEVEMRPAPPANEVDDLFAEFVGEVGDIPHGDYLQFMRRHNGCDGPVGRNGYIRIWTLDNVILRTEQAKVDEVAPGLLLFAGDGGGEAYAFDRQAPGWPIVSVPLAGLSRKEMRFVAGTFRDFIHKLANDEV